MFVSQENGDVADLPDTAVVLFLMICRKRLTAYTRCDKPQAAGADEPVMAPMGQYRGTRNDASKAVLQLLHVFSFLCSFVGHPFDVQLADSSCLALRFRAHRRVEHRRSATTRGVSQPLVGQASMVVRI